jgi:hypothetical protein
LGGLRDGNWHRAANGFVDTVFISAGVTGSFRGTVDWVKAVREASKAGGVWSKLKALWAELRVCFAAGTPIQTPTGARPIESLRPSDLVWSRNEHDPHGPVEAKLVEEVFVRQGIIWHLHIGGQVIRTTGEHPFWVRDRGWVEAELLTSQDWLLDQSGHFVRVEEVFCTGEWELVYNVRVAEYHTYFVGCEEWGFDVWAHNADYSTADLRAVLEIEGRTIDSTLGSRLANRLRKEDFATATRLLEQNGIGGNGVDLAQKVLAYRALRETGMSHAEVARYYQILGDVHLFRGTAPGLPGTPGTVGTGRSWVSIDPARATVFATVSETQFGAGIVYSGSRAQLGGVVGPGNRVYGNPTSKMILEREVSLPFTPSEMARIAPNQTTVAQARQILSEMGIDVSRGLGIADIDRVLSELPRMTPEQIQIFILRLNGLI